MDALEHYSSSPLPRKSILITVIAHYGAPVADMVLFMKAAHIYGDDLEMIGTVFL